MSHVKAAMKGNEAIEPQIQERIVALLFSLADLAQQASLRSYPVRCFILWLLHRAETVARDWIWADGTNEMHPMRSADDRPQAIGISFRNSRADAIHLARAFRALARELGRQIRMEGQFARRLTRPDGDSAATDLLQTGVCPAELMAGPLRAIEAALHNVCRRTFALARPLDTS